VAEQAAYDLPADVLALLLVSLPAVPDVQPLTPEQFRQGNYGYMIRAGEIHLIPTPTVAVTAGLIIEYMADPEAVSEETDEVPLGKDYRDLLIDLTLVQAKNRQKEDANVTAMLYQMTMGPHLMRHAMMNLGTNNWPAPLKRGPA